MPAGRSWAPSRGRGAHDPSCHAVGQIVLQFDDDAQGEPQLTYRYLWGAAVDQILADEQVTDLTTPGDVLWTLADHAGPARRLDRGLTANCRLQIEN